MKRLFTSVFTICLLSIASLLYAQDSFEGVINYNIEYKQLPQQMEAQREMLPKNMKVSFKNHKSRMEQTIGNGGSQVIISDNEKKIGYLAMDMMSQKILVVIPKDKYEESMKRNKDVEIEYHDEIKNIAGYDCKKAVVKQSGNELTVYYTEELPSQALKDFNQLKGLPLQYEAYQNGMHMVISATDVSKKSIDSKIFEKPTGYQEMSIEQIQQMTGGSFDF